MSKAQPLPSQLIAIWWSCNNPTKSSIYSGALATNPTVTLKPLDAINGETGAFAANKYFTINEAGFYDKLDALNASVRVMATTMVASGNIGANAAPVEQAK